MTELNPTSGARAHVHFALLALVLLSMPIPVACAQIPGLPQAAAGPQANPVGGTPPAHAGEKPKSAVAAPTGPISVHQQVSDKTLERFLAKFLPKYPGIRRTSVSVDDGVVTIEGQVQDDDTSDEVTDVVKRVEGVRLVMNQMKTDDEMMSAWEFAARDLASVGGYFQRTWLLMVFAAAIIVVSALLARLFATRSETILAPFVRNVLMRSVTGSLISSLLFFGGLMLALGALRLTHLVLSIVGVASIVGLAVGFAFRDITENFIASVLLGLRRPFQIGDFIAVAGQTGVVKSLNTRATVLVTLEGNHVRIPNATVFKEIMVNSTASPSFRNSFDVVIPNDASVADAIAAINRTLKDLNGILQDPPPRALVEALEPDAVRIRAYLWAPTRNADWLQLLSEAKLKTKVALQQAGVIGTAATVAPAPAVGQSRASHQTTAADPSPAPANRAAANLRRDSQATTARSRDDEEKRETPVDRVLEEPETRVSNEGANLLNGARQE
jgi:small conductance mechanosensitive channel